MARRICRGCFLAYVGDLKKAVWALHRRFDALPGFSRSWLGIDTTLYIVSYLNWCATRYSHCILWLTNIIRCELKFMACVVVLFRPNLGETHSTHSSACDEKTKVNRSTLRYVVYCAGKRHVSTGTAYYTRTRRYSFLSCLALNWFLRRNLAQVSWVELSSVARHAFELINVLARARACVQCIQHWHDLSVYTIPFF